MPDIAGMDGLDDALAGELRAVLDVVLAGGMATDLTPARAAPACSTDSPSRAPGGTGSGMDCTSKVTVQVLRDGRDERAAGEQVAEHA